MEEKIKNLQDLKIRLIADVVTGKVDVRDVIIPDYEYVNEDIDSEINEDPEEAEEQED